MITPLPGKSFIVAGALAMSGIIAGAVSGGRAPAPVVTKATAAQFDQRWEDVSTDDQPLLKKQDRLALVAEPKTVPVERVVPDEPVLPPPVEKRRSRCERKRRA